MSVLAHHVLLGLAAAALIGAGLRLASLAAPTGLERVIAAVAYAAALAVVEAIALGRFGIGAQALPLGVVAALTWVTAALVLPAPDVGVAEELRGAWRRVGTWSRVGVAAAAGVGIAYAVWLVRHPAIGLDSNVYHYLEVSRWLHDGGIGGFERLDYGVSYSSYPLTNEVLLAWGGGIARSFVALALWMPASLALAGMATWRGLRDLDVPLAPTVLGVAALITLPLAVRELNAPSTDLPALAWLACTGALCTAAVRRPALLAPALVAAALALGSKTTVLVPLLACLLTTVWVLRGRLRSIARGLVLASIAAVAVGGIWFIRNIALYGSPLWPHVPAPWGAARPRYFEVIGERFLARPEATLHGHVATYLGRTAGGLLLLAAALLVPLAATRLAGVQVSSGRRRGLLAVGAVAALAVLAWGLAPVTGLPRETGLQRPDVDAISGLRYLLPALLTAIVAIGLAAREGGRAASAATGVLAAAVLWNVIELAQLGPPYTPSLLVVAVGATAGLLALGVGAAASRALGRPGVPRWGAGAAGGAVIAVLVGALMALGATGYIERFSRLRQSTALGRPVVAWMLNQPGFKHGHRPIAFASRAPIAALAGDRFNHILRVIPPFENCAAVRARAQRGWVVVSDPAYGYGFLSVDPYSTAECFAGRSARYDDGTYRVYSGA